MHMLINIFARVVKHLTTEDKNTINNSRQVMLHNLTQKTCRLVNNENTNKTMQIISIALMIAYFPLSLALAYVVTYVLS